MISTLYRTNSTQWDQLTRTERLLLPGLKPGAQAPSLAWEFALGSMVAAMIGFGASSWPIRSGR